MASIDLLDINVWVALSMTEHGHHKRANAYWQDEAQSNVAFNTHTALGLVRVLSNAYRLAGKPLSATDSWQVFQRWLSDRAVVFAREPLRCLDILDRYVASGLVQPRTWSDVYLAAFAEAAEMRLVSFDSDFHKFPSLNWLHLKA